MEPTTPNIHGDTNSVPQAHSISSIYNQSNVNSNVSSHPPIFEIDMTPTSAQSTQDTPVVPVPSVPTPASPSSLLPKTNSQYFNNSIFWIEVEKIVPNPYQPRREFDPHALKDLSESIRMYGLLQPLVVTRREIIKEDGGLVVQYELISGERRLRASKLGGLVQVPVIIRAGEEDARVKLELAIIENLQREDLNAVDRARSFQRLADEFGLKHVQIAEKMGKSREYVTNSIRLLSLPAHMLTALSEKKISEGHTRPLLMLVDRPDEQETLFKEIVFKKITVREAESIARRVAVERTRKKDLNAPDPEIREFETKLNQALGTRVMIEKREQGGKVVIDFFSNQDLRHLLDILEHKDNPASRGFAQSQDANGVDMIPAPLRPLFNSMPDYVPGVQNTVAPTIASNPVMTQSFSENIVDTTSHIAVDTFSNVNALASAINNAAIITEQQLKPENDVVQLIHTEIEPKEFGVNSLDESGIISHLEPSMNINSLSGNTMNHEDQPISSVADAIMPIDDSTPADARDDEDLYSIKNFSI